MGNNIVLPTPEQVEWAECEIGVIIHLDMFTFTGTVIGHKRILELPVGVRKVKLDIMDTVEQPHLRFLELFGTY